ncbi:MAG: hypothetical protein M3Q56_05570 [Bacteroidota bacterium]|nr:hypothetical protein [Bacteroidota bacterium]
MHDIEPFFNWRELYNSSEDENSPFFGREYNEFQYSNRIYNFLIHPHWDAIGSENLYIKILYADYEEHFAIFEFIGEWNDCLANDIMFLKRDIIDVLINKGITKFILLVEHVLNFHGSDDCYYEEWREDIADNGGWICFINTLPHVKEEMKTFNIHQYVHVGKKFSDINWRKMDPDSLFDWVEKKLSKQNV